MRRRTYQAMDLMQAQLVRRLSLASQPVPMAARPAQTIAKLVLVGLLAVGIIWVAADLMMRGGQP